MIDLFQRDRSGTIMTEKTVQRGLATGLVVIAAVIVGTAVLTYSNLDAIFDVRQQSFGIRARLDDLRQLEVDLDEAETGQRGFLLTGNETYLEPYRLAAPAIIDRLDRLHAGEQQNPVQRALLEQLEVRSREKLDELKETIDLRRSSGLDAALKIVESGRGEDEMDEIRRLSDQLVANQTQELLQRRASATLAYQMARESCWLGGTLGLLGVVLVWLIARRQLVERERAAKTLFDEKERLRVTLASIGDGVIVTNADGEVTYLNGIAENLTGWKTPAAAGMALTSVFNIVNEMSREPVDNPAFRAIREGVIVGLANHTILISKSGGECPINDSAAPIRDRDGKLVGSVLVFRDVTEHKQAERALLEADRQKDEFIAVLAHELRNPLAPLQNALEVIRRTDGDRDAIERMSQIVDRQIRHMVRLIDDLLDIARVTRNKLELRFERGDAFSVIESAIEMVGPTLEAFGENFTVLLPEENFDIIVDRTRIIQAISNLLSNAAKFTPPDGRIKLRVWRDGETFNVAVVDSGTGIPPDKLDRVFGLFVQVDRSLETTRGGLGIGLALVRRITDMHGGRVVARSDGIGQGAEFIISLPVACDVLTQSGSNDSASNVVAAGCRVLVADDSPDSADTLAMMLELAGHEVRTAYDGEAAVREAEAFAPEVIILDIAMPRLNGFEAARKIRASGEVTPVLIALTGYGQAQDRSRSAAAGFDYHLVKPVDVDALEAIIVRAKSFGRNDKGATA